MIPINRICGFLTTAASQLIGPAHPFTTSPVAVKTKVAAPVDTARDTAKSEATYEIFCKGGVPGGVAVSVKPKIDETEEMIKVCREKFIHGVINEKTSHGQPQLLVTICGMLSNPQMRDQVIKQMQGITQKFPKDTSILLQSTIDRCVEGMKKPGLAHQK